MKTQTFTLKLHSLSSGLLQAEKPMTDARSNIGLFTLSFLHFLPYSLSTPLSTYSNGEERGRRIKSRTGLAGWYGCHLTSGPST